MNLFYLLKLSFYNDPTTNTSSIDEKISSQIFLQTPGLIAKYSLRSAIISVCSFSQASEASPTSRDSSSQEEAFLSFGLCSATNL
jgi:hypothetical protein